MKLFKFLLAFFAGIYVASLVYVLSFSWRPNLPKHADAALILGAKVNLDNSPSLPLYNRTLTAVDLYKSKKTDYLIATGGQGLGPDAESKISKDIAEQAGVPASKIIVEFNSHNTFENVVDVLDLAKKNNIKSLVIVSDRFHVARGVFVARHFGFTPVYWDFPDEKYYKPSQLVWNYLREAAAMLYYVPKTALDLDLQAGQPNTDPIKS